MKKTLLCLSALLAFSATANNFENTDDAIHYRESAFGLIAYQFGDMGAMLKGKKDSTQRFLHSALPTWPLCQSCLPKVLSMVLTKATPKPCPKFGKTRPTSTAA